MAKGGGAQALLVLGGAAFVLSHQPAAAAHASIHHRHARHTVHAPTRAARIAVSYAEHQLGKPYVYGATGPGAYDCSGLVMEAWAAAGVAIPRTSEQQWASLPHVGRPQPGDLVFYTGSSIDSPPGHVTMYVGGGRMAEAYGTGVPIRITAVRAGAWGYAQP